MVGVERELQYVVETLQSPRKMLGEWGQQHPCTQHEVKYIITSKREAQHWMISGTFRFIKQCNLNAQKTLKLERK